MAKNKRCPWCGSGPNIRRTKTKYCQLHGDPYQDWIVCCPKGHASFEDSTEFGALKKWNTRYEENHYE